MAGQNNFIIDLIAALDKVRSKLQIQTDIKSLGDLYVSLIGNLNIQKTIKNIKSQSKTLNNAITINPTVNTKGVQNATKQVIKSAQKVANNNKVKITYSFDDDKRKLQNQLKNFARANSKLFTSKDMTLKYNQLVDSANIAKSKSELQGLRSQLSAFKTELQAVNKAGMTWTDKFRSSISHFTQYFSGASFIYAVTDQMRNAWTEAKTLDDRLVDLQKVTDEIDNRNSLYKYLDRSIDKANELNVKVDSLIYAITEFKKMGWSLSDAELGGKWSNILSNVGDVNIDTAIGSIKTAIASFEKIGGYGNDQMDKKLEAYVDLINNMSNKYSIDAEGLAEAVRLSAGTLTEANTSIEQAVTMFATANKYYNDPSYLGNTAKVGSLRLRATKGDKEALKDLEEMGEDIEGVTLLTGKLRDELLSLTGVDIMVDNNTFKSYYDQLYEISQVIGDLDDTSSAKVLEDLFGKNRAAAGMSLLSGLQESEKAYADAINSAGSATQEYETWTQSADAATQRFSNSLTEMYQSIINGNTVRDLANMGSALIDFANAWGIVEGAAKGYIALKVGSLIVNGGMAFVTATKQVEQYGKALQLANNVPNGNLSQRFSTLKSIAQVTNTLTSAQLKQVMSSQALSQQDRIRILQMQGMTKEMALQKLAEMNLTSATNAQTAANTASTASTFSLKSAMVGLGATIKGVFLSNPVGIALMGISLGVSAVSSAVSNHNQKMEEMRDKAKQAADSANTLGDEIAELANKYIQLSEAVKTDSGAKEDLMSTQTELLKKLGLEGESIDDLIAKYGSLSNAIRQASIDSLQNSRIDLLAGVNAAKEELLDVGKDGFWGGNNIINATGDDAVKAFQELEKAGIVDSASYGTAGGSLVLIGDDKTTEGILENYERLEKGLAALRDSNAFTAEELSDNSLYQAMYARYSEMTDAVGSYKNAINELNENVAQETTLTALQGKEIPKTEAEFNAFKQELIDTAVASKQFIGTEKEIMDTINNYLATVPQFQGFYSVPIEEEVAKVDEVLSRVSFKSFTDAWEDLKASTEDETKGLADKLTELAQAGRLTSEALLEADSSKYFENLGISADDAVQKINELVSASTQLNALSGQISKMSDMLADKKHKKTASAADLAGFDVEVRGLDSWKEFEAVMGDSTSSIEDCQKAANALATEWVNNSNFLANLTEQNKQYYITQLDNMGIENAEAIVEATLTQKINEEALATEYATIATAYNSSEKGRNNQITTDLINITGGEIQQLLNEGKVSVDTANDLANLVVQKKIASGTTLSTAADIKNLADLAGASTKLGKLLNQLAAIKQGFTNGMPSDAAAAQAESLQKQIEALVGGGNNTAVVDVPVQIKPTGSSTYKAPSSGSKKKDTKQTIEWIERLLDVLQKKIDALKAAFDNAFTLKDKKNNLTKQITLTKNLLTATTKAAEKYKKAASNVKLSSDLKKKVQNGSYDIKDYDSNTADAINKYKDYYDKYKDLKKQVDELTTDIRSLREQRYQLYVADAEAKIAKSQAYAELDAGNYKEQNKHLEAQKKYLKQQYDYQIKIAKLNKDSVEVAKLKAEYQKEIADLTKQEFDNIANTYDNKVGLTNNKIQAFQSQIDLLEARGQKVGSALYTKQISLNNTNTKKLLAEKEALLEKLADFKRGSDDWYEAQSKLFEVDQELVNIQIENANLQKSINQLKFDRFDDLLDKLNAIVNETNFLINALNSDNFFDDSGKITSEGITAMGLNAQNYNVYLAEAQKYKEQMAQLEQMYASGAVDAETYESKMLEYQQGQRDMISSANDCKAAVIDLVKQGMELQNKALEDAISKQKELLNVQKESRDFSRKLLDLDKEIARTERQLQVLSGDDSESNRKTIRELKSKLEDLKQDRDDTLYDKSVEQQQDALDKMLEDAKNATDSYLKDTDRVFIEALNLVNTNTEQVSQHLAQISKDTGYTISENITNAWKGAGNAVGTYESILQGNVPKINLQIESITTKWSELALAAEEAAEAMKNAVTDNYLEYTTMGADNNGSGSGSSSSKTSSSTKKYSLSDIDNFIMGNLHKATNDKSKYAALNQYIYGKTGGYVLTKENEKKLAEMLNVSLSSDLTGTAGKKDLQKILDALIKKGWKVNQSDVKGYSKGGIISSIGDAIRQNGDKVLVSANPGERILTAEQNENWEKWTKALPNLMNLTDVIKPNINIPTPNLTVASRNLQPVTNNINVNTTVEGVATDKIVKDFENVATKSVEKAFTKVNNIGYTSKNISRR